MSSTQQIFSSEIPTNQSQTKTKTKNAEPQNGDCVPSKETNSSLVLGDEAHFLAATGRRILPLVPDSKRPLLHNGLSGASSCPSQVSEWWERWPDANIGMVLDDLLVLDNDNPKHGGDLSATIHLSAPCVLTPSGGTHQYFARPASMTHKTSADHIDFLTKGAYVLMPPSVVGGKPYRWISGSPDMLLGVTPPDSRVLGKLLTGGTHGDDGLDLSSIEEGSRNNKLYGLGTRLLCFGYPFCLVEHILSFVEQHILGGLDAHELDRIVSSLHRYKATYAGRLWQSPRDRLSEAELDHKLALLAGVLRGAYAGYDMLLVCFCAVIRYVTTTATIGRSWVHRRAITALRYKPNYSHFLRRNGGADELWRTS